MSLDRMSCCGYLEESDIRDFDTALEGLKDWFYTCHREYEWTFAGIVFTDNLLRKKGIALAKLIRSAKIGSIVSSRPKLNRNTDNTVQMWIWNVDEAAFKRFAKKKKWYDPNEKEEIVDIESDRYSYAWGYPTPPR